MNALIKVITSLQLCLTGRSFLPAGWAYMERKHFEIHLHAAEEDIRTHDLEGFWALS